MAYNQLQHLRDNIAAIRIALDFREGIRPQPEEYAALAAGTPCAVLSRGRDP
jgi:hypothetical protein